MSKTSHDSSSDFSAQAEKLRAQIRHHDELYYQQAKPEISDQEYDALMRQLIDLEAVHPELAAPDSPTHRVGGKPIDGFEPYQHAVPMMSIDNTYDESEVRSFDLRVKKMLGTDDVAYTCEPKIDGLSLSLRYEGGLLVAAATRGNGRTGDNVTVNAKTIHNIPLRLKVESTGLFGGDAPSVIEVRGEVFLSRKQFLKINQQQEELGLEQYANPRNTAAGTLKLLDSKMVAARKLDFLPHGAGQIEGLSVGTYEQWQKELARFGFRVNEYFTRVNRIDDVIAYLHEFAQKRPQLAYDTDGVVIKVDRFDQREKLGVTAKAPRWCIAYKYQPEQAETELARVVFQVGKTGTITPVAEFEPAVFISGTNVYRASLHNFDEIERKDIRLHDRVLVEKAGEVIPYVVGVVANKRPADAQEILRPLKCPSCESKNLLNDGGFVRCQNPSCPAQLKERIAYFCARGQMDIAEVGDSVIDCLLKNNLVSGLTDLFRIKAEQIEPLTVSEYEKTVTKKKKKKASAADDALFKEETESKTVRVTIGPVRAQNIIRSIEDAKNRGLARLLAGLGISHIGAVTARLVAQHFPSYDLLYAATIEQLLALPQMGKDVINNVEKLKAKVELCSALSNMQLLGLEPIPHEIEKELERLAYSEKNEKTVADKIREIRESGVAARALFAFVHSDSGEKVFAECRQLGLKLDEPQQERPAHQPFAGQTIVVTGSLQKYSREEIKKEIDRLGGKTSESVSKKTSFVLAGDEAGSKLEKANQLGVPVIDEAEFIRRAGLE